MNKITVSLKSLKEKLLQMENDNISMAELYIVPGQTEDGAIYPAFLHIDGVFQNGECKDYESIDESLIAEYSGIHKSA